jgi:hypothetical protein
MGVVRFGPFGGASRYFLLLGSASLLHRHCATFKLDQYTQTMLKWTVAPMIATFVKPYPGNANNTRGGGRHIVILTCMKNRTKERTG